MLYSCESEGAAPGLFLVVCTSLSGLCFWLLYLAIQPRNYARDFGTPGRLETVFGWQAPAIDPSDFIERDRLYVAVAGWFLVAALGGRARPRSWPWVGPLTIAGPLALFYPTSPHDAQGWWTLNIVSLVLLVVVLSVVARAAASPPLDDVFRRPVLFAVAVGMTFTAAALAGGGESVGVVVAVGVTAAVIAGAGSFYGRRVEPGHL